MEVLKILIDQAGDNIALTPSNTVRFWLSTKNFGVTRPTLGLGDATVLATYNRSTQVTTSGIASVQLPIEMNYSDDAGHGMLIGNQNLYWGIASTATGVANRIDVKVLYRAKRISDSELLGIVLQSNQN